MLRRKGNERYARGHLEAALEHYTQAKAVVDIIHSHSRQEQREIAVNKAAVCLNIAAVHLGQHHCTQAIQLCTEAMSAAPPTAKAHLRRAKAHMLLHQYEVRSQSCRCARCRSQACQALAQLFEVCVMQDCELDIQAAEKLESGNAELTTLRKALQKHRAVGAQQERELFAGKFTASAKLVH